MDFPSLNLLFSAAWPRGDAEPGRGVGHWPGADLLRAQHDEGVSPGPRPADQGQQPARAGGVGGAGQDQGCGQGGEATHNITQILNWKQKKF